jgi:RimJ/RimL family protein N-acetyltransferase
MSDFPLDRTHPPRRIEYLGDPAIELRPWAFHDVDALLVAIDQSRAELGAFMPWAHTEMSREAEYDLLRDFDAHYWAGREYVIGVFSPSGEILGGVGLHPRTSLNPRALEVGYWCHTRHAGKGITTQAVRVLVALAFDHFGCDRLQVQHDEANVASRRVVEKCGFAFEGTLRNVIAEPSPELVQKGYAITGRTRMYAICPEDLPSLPWLAEVRARLRITDGMGAVRERV